MRNPGALNPNRSLACFSVGSGAGLLGQISRHFMPLALGSGFTGLGLKGLRCRAEGTADDLNCW